MTASDLEVGETYEGGKGNPRTKRRISRINTSHVWYYPVLKRRGYGYNVRQDIAGFLRWCNQAERQETAAAQNPACAQEQSNEAIRREGELAGMRKALEAVQEERLNGRDLYLAIAANIEYGMNAIKDFSDEGYSAALDDAESAILAKMEEVKS